MVSRQSIANGLPDVNRQKLSIPLLQVQGIGLLVGFLCLHCLDSAVMGGNQLLSSGKLKLASVDQVRPNEIYSSHDKMGKMNCGASCSSLLGGLEGAVGDLFRLCSWTDVSLSAAELVSAIRTPEKAAHCMFVS